MVTNRSFTNLVLVMALTSWYLPAQDVSRFLEEAKQAYREAKDNLLKSAEEMPAENYHFGPTPEASTFGQLVRQAASLQMSICSALLGNHLPRNGPQSESKTELLAALKQSIRTCDSAYLSVNSLNADQELDLGTGRRSKLGLLFLNATRDQEFYGQMAVYLRLKGFTPPSKQVHVIPVD